jgi:hypothetical protein
MLLILIGVTFFVKEYTRQFSSYFGDKFLVLQDKVCSLRSVRSSYKRFSNRQDVTNFIDSKTVSVTNMAITRANPCQADCKILLCG